MWSKVVVGSNVFLNDGGVPGILIVDGEKQVFLERADGSGELLLSIDLYDATGKRIGKLRRNAWPPAHDPTQFTVRTNPASLVLATRLTGDVIFEARVQGPNELLVSRGRFYTRTARLIEITPDHWSIGGVSMAGNTFTNCTAGVTLRGSDFRIG